MKQKATVSRDTLWAALPLLRTRINEIREAMLYRKDPKGYYDFCEQLLEEHLRAYNEIARVLGIRETKNEKEV